MQFKELEGKNQGRLNHKENNANALGPKNLKAPNFKHIFI